MINIKLKLAMAGFAALPVFLFAKDEKLTKPNVLFIAIDDLKPVLGCYGNIITQSPRPI